MTAAHLRLECLKLAHQYAAPGATLHDIFERTRELEGFVGRVGERVPPGYVDLPGYEGPPGGWK